MKGFETEQYMEAQLGAFRERVDQFNSAPPLFEFGGKPFDDQHAARVLPGYEVDAKIDILASLMPENLMVMVVNARDLLAPPDGRYAKGRIRGDSQLFYEDEVLRLILKARMHGLRVDKTVISVTPRELVESKNKMVLDRVQNKLAKIGMHSQRFFGISCYPKTDGSFNEYAETFEANGPLAENGAGVVVFSPGGGSGKFGVLLSEAYFRLSEKNPPNYIKFETFPVFDLDWQHALNLAFLAATADLGNKTVRLGRNATTYDKDVENFALLKWLFQTMGFGDSVDHIQNPMEMGVNRIAEGVTDWKIVIDACRAEIARRIARYTLEVQKGIESPQTLLYAKSISAIFDKKYIPNQSKVFVFR